MVSYGHVRGAVVVNVHRCFCERYGRNHVNERHITYTTHATTKQLKCIIIYINMYTYTI